MTGRGDAPSKLTRRQALAGLAAAAWPPPARAGAPARIVSLDWALTAALLALGATPAGVAEPDGYRHWVAEPALPAAARDVGLRLEPNLELLAALRPDLVLVNPMHEGIRPLLERIGPVLAYNLYTAEGRPLERARAMNADLGRRLGREAEAEAVLARAEAAFEGAARRLAGRAGRGLIVAGVVDPRHVNVYGRGSLFGDVLARLGLANAWARPVNDWGVAVAAVEELADYPDAVLVLVEPVPPAAERALTRLGLWAGLVAARRAELVRLPAAWPFGEVTAALRFAEALAARLGGGA